MLVNTETHQTASIRACRDHRKVRPGEEVTYVGSGESEVMSKWDRARLVSSPEILTRDKNRNEVNHGTEDGASLTAVRQTRPLVIAVIVRISVLMLPVVGAGRSKKNIQCGIVSLKAVP